MTWPVSPIPVGKTIAATATFTDADVPESAPYTATISWGDGSVSTIDCSSPGDISATHAYGAPGLFGITITVRQNNLTTHSDTKRLEYVVVFEDNGNFATGGGWLNAVTGLPAGAPPADKATFGFVARYDQGSSAPVGNLEFNTHDGTLRFKSVSYDWLMVDGTLARFQGVGTLNGQGQYGFLVAATAGDPGSGRMRIRIWELATNRVIYDNQFGEANGASPGVPLAGGKIQVK